MSLCARFFLMVKNECSVEDLLAEEILASGKIGERILLDARMTCVVSGQGAVFASIAPRSSKVAFWASVNPLIPVISSRS